MPRINIYILRALPTEDSRIIHNMTAFVQYAGCNDSDL